MKVTVDLTEAVWVKLMDRAATKDSKGVAVVAAQTISRFADIPQSDRVLIVKAPERRRLEEIIQTTVGSSEELIDLVRRMSQVKIGVVEYPLTSAQTIALTEQARFHGWDVAGYIKMTTDECMGRMLGML